MLAKVLGIQKVSYVSKQNKQVEGTSLHVCYPDDNVEGMAVDKIYISKSTNINNLPLVKLNAEIDLRYNKYGKIESIEIL